MKTTVTTLLTALDAFLSKPSLAISLAVDGYYLEKHHVISLDPIEIGEKQYPVKLIEISFKTYCRKRIPKTYVSRFSPHWKTK